MDPFVSAVQAAGLAGKVPYLVGAPGIGKTAVAKAIARDLQADLFLICLAQRAGNEIHGIPIVAKEPIKIGTQEFTVVRQSPPAYAVEAKQSERALLFFDEFNQLSPTDAGQAMTICSERRIGESSLAKNQVMMMAAGNPPEMSAGGWKMPPPVRRRLVVLPMEVDAKSWASPHAFPTNWGYPLEPLQVFGEKHAITEEERLRKRTILAGWVHSKPDIFINTNVAKMLEGYVCPATCDDAADLLASIDKFVPKAQQGGARQALLTGCLGPIGCNGIMTFMDNLDVPDAREVLDNPKPFFASFSEKSLDPAKLYYFLMSLVEETRFRTKAHKEDPKESLLKKAQTAWYNGMEIAGFLSKKKAPSDFLVMFVGNMQNADVIPKKVDVNKCDVIDEFASLISVMRAAGFNWVQLGNLKPEEAPKKK